MITVGQNTVLVFIAITSQAVVLGNSYEYNPFGTGHQGVQPPLKPKQTINQVQLSVVVPPGSQLPQGNQPPGPPSPEYVWLQVPASYFTQSPPVVNPGVQAPEIPNAGQSVNLQPVTPANPPITSSPPTGDVLLAKCLKPRGQFPSNACNKYVNCWDGVAVEQFCPESLVFNPKGFCDYVENVNCDGKPTEAIPPPPTSSDTTTVSSAASSLAPTTAVPPTVIVTLPTIDPTLRKRCLQPRGQFRSSTCNKYVNCWDEVVVEQECPEGLLFSNKGYCDYAANVDCMNKTIPMRNEQTGDSECPIGFGTFREKVNCSNYFTCIAGQVVARYTCPQGFSFNDNLGVCDYADRVDCSKEPLIFSPKSNFLANVPKDFMQQIDNCIPGAVLPLNQQCTAACLCRTGVSEVVQCPAGLAYDSRTDKCLLPHLAKC